MCGTLLLGYCCQVAIETKGAKWLLLAAIVAVVLGPWFSLFKVAYKPNEDQVMGKSLEQIH